MIFAALIISAVAVFLGIFTKFPQGGGGLTNNLMVMSLLYSNPPLLPPPLPPRANLYDLDAKILETWQYYIHGPPSARNVTVGPMPSPLAKPRAPGSKITPASNSTFQFSDFSSPALPLCLKFFQLCFTIGETVTRIAMVLFALCSPWLAVRKMHLLYMNVPARKAARTSLVVGTRFENELWQIQPQSPHFGELKIALSERDQALVELMLITGKATEEAKKALERDCKTEEDLKRLREERDNELVQLASVRRNLGKLQKEMKDETEGLKRETIEQAKDWEEKKKDWEKNRAVTNKRNQDEKDSLNMGRARERESWKKEVDKAETEKKKEKERMDARLKFILQRWKKEKEGWAKEREEWNKDKAEQAREKEKANAEMKALEKQTNEDKKFREEANDRARGRIIKLENENKILTDEAVEKERLIKERDTTRKASEEARVEDQKRREKELQSETRNKISNLEEEVLNGRKLIEDLQGDKRRDGQLLLELRALLARPTHATPLSHTNPLRFGQTAMTRPVVASPSAADYTRPSASPRAALPPILPSNPPPTSLSPISSTTAVNQKVDLLFTPLSPRPIVRLPPPPPPRQVIPAQLPAPILAPPNAPKGPKGWTPGPSGGRGRGK